MPTITTGNLNAPTIMIGEKGADHVRGRALLPAANVPVYVAASWQTVTALRLPCTCPAGASVNQSTGSSVTVTEVNGVCEIVVNSQPPQPC